MPQSRNWLKIGGLGCLVLIGVAVLALGGSVALIKLGGQRAIDSREALNEAQADPESFTPAAGGTLAPERIEAFLAVRRQLSNRGDEIGRHVEAFTRMGKYEETDREPPAGEFFRDLGTALKGMVGLARRLNSYLETRNRALLEHGMGLGEFTWIQVVAYHAWLGHPAQPFALAQEDEPRVIQDRVVPQVREMIRRHIAAWETEPDPTGRLDPWHRELAALEADPERVPFADGVPAEIAASLAPFREELERLYCPATCEVDLTITTHEGIGFEHI